MKLILASSNKNKIEEIKVLLPSFEVVTYESILGDVEIIEDGNSFKDNAIKKAQTIYNRLGHNNDIVIADDSGISVEFLDNEPNIYSARYAGVHATDVENNNKLIYKLKEKNLNQSPAFYTASIAMIYNSKIYTTHGWLYGSVSTTPKGKNGFGYDPLFTPQGYKETLGMMSNEIKYSISHRTKALALIKKLMKVVIK